MLDISHLSTIFDTVAAKAKAIVTRDLPTSIFSTKFLVIAAVVGFGCWLFWQDKAGVLDLMKWGAILYVAQRLVEGTVTTVCSTYIQAVTIKSATTAAKAPGTP
jgi:hypothetical protein